MFNPCYIFSSELLEAMIAKGVVHFVRSTYTRGAAKHDPDFKGSFLMSHYHDPAEAERHYNAIRTDPHRFLYNAGDPEHLEKLRQAAAQPEGYRVYSKVMIPGIQKKANILFKENTRRYLFKYTRWNLRGRVTIEPELYFQLGELYVRIAHQGDEIKIKFEELENS